MDYKIYRGIWLIAEFVVRSDRDECLELMQHKYPETIFSKEECK